MILRKLFILAFSATLPFGVIQGHAQAQNDFTFKRLEPPSGQQDSLLNIQVEPKSEIRPVLEPRIDPETDLAIADPETSSEAGWFWRKISPGMRDLSPRRLEAALQHLEQNPDKMAEFGENRAQIELLASRFGVDILKASIETQVSPALILAVIMVESGGNPDAGGPTGPAGLMQIRPLIANQFEVEDVMDPVQNIAAGAQYIEWLLDRFEGDPILALAAYNTAEQIIRSSKGVPDYPETRLYVPKVVAVWRIARQLCMTPPVRATDGCLFKSLNTASE